MTQAAQPATAIAPTAALTRRFVSPQALPAAAALAETVAIPRRAFRIGPLEILIPEGLAGEVLDEPPVFPIPGAPGACLGLINLRGRLVPLFQVHRSVGVTAGDAPQTLVLGRGGDALALRVDGLPHRVLPQRRLALVPPLPGDLADHVEAAYAAGDAVLLEIDLGAFVRSRP